jgi:diguanylate cyclase (GGDEF)-like protein
MALRVEADQEREKIEDQLRYDALHDYLTHLPNRALFIDRLDMAIARTKRTAIPYSVLILDLDDFKQINDTRGHIAGDDLLVCVADRLKQCVRITDTVARLGGDEFIVLLENTDQVGAVQISCERILEEFKKPFEFADKKSNFISVSIGVVEDISNYEIASDILRDADIAMYHAKDKGKSRYEVFRPELRDKTIQRVLIENELRYAIEHNEFFLQYQPFFSLSTNALQGFEALIRWNNPRLGMQSPGMFIPVAEETGMIIEIGDWVLNEACWQLKAWHDRFPLLQHLVVNVNISGKQFAKPDFMDKLKAAIQTTGLDSTKLKLEITETVLLDNKLRDSDMFNTLRQMGILLQIDDFGTGYSSLSYLQHIPMDIIKIDRSFIKELGKGEKSIDLIHAIVRMAHSLNMQTTAEGIETWEQKEILTGMDCDYGQGFLLARPMDASLIEEYLSGENREVQEARSDGK